MTALYSLLSKSFPPGVRSRGAEVYSLGKVRVISGTAWEVEAKVQGSELYTVRLRLLNNEVHVSCTCPYYEGTGPCKHLWATILHAESAGLLRGDVALSKLVMVEQVAAEEDDDDLDIDISLDKPWLTFPARAPGPKQAPAKRLAAPPRPPD